MNCDVLDFHFPLPVCVGMLMLDQLIFFLAILFHHTSFPVNYGMQSIARGNHEVNELRHPPSFTFSRKECSQPKWSCSCSIRSSSIGSSPNLQRDYLATMQTDRMHDEMVNMSISQVVVVVWRHLFTHQNTLPQRQGKHRDREPSRTTAL